MSNRVIHVVHVWGKEPRHLRARENWGKFYAQGIIPVHCHDYWRDSRRELRDPRELPYLKDVLKRGMQQATAKEDVIIWANDDVAFADGIKEWAENDVYLSGAISMRRNEDGHIGRELFAFTKGWLDENLNLIPDFVQGCPYFDLVVAALIRKKHGIYSTLENMGIDIWPADSKERLALHEPHPSSWAGAMEHKYPANLWNRRLAIKWAQTHMPSMKL